MKEMYVKPLICVESFALTQTIARSCGDTHQSTLGQSKHADENTCAWDIGGYTIFYDATYCEDDDPGPIDEIEGYCYNNPDGGVTLFAS